MRVSTVLLVSLLVLSVFSQNVTETGKVQRAEYELKGFVSQEKQIKFDKYPNPYQIHVERLSSSNPHSGLNCKGFGRSMDFTGDKLLVHFPIMQLRLDTHLTEMASHEDSLFRSLTVLDTEEEIVEFESIQNYYFVITTANNVYFLKEAADGTLSKVAQVSLPDTVKDKVAAKDFFVLVVDFAPLLIFPNAAILCTEGMCKELPGWRPIVELTHATFLKTDGKKFILLGLNTLGFSIYELTANNELQFIRSFDARAFNRSTVSIHDINAQSIEKGEIYVLDFESGLYSFNYVAGNPRSLKFNKKILNQTNCFAMDVKGYKYFVMNCRAGSADYLLEVFHTSALDSYVTSRPMYKYEKIFDLDLADTYYASRGYSGFKFYWVSPDTKFPHEYKHAGDLFLHNAIQARFKGSELIYATYNEIRKIQVIQKAPFASCVSDSPTAETYKITYKTPCPDSNGTASPNSEGICTYDDTIKYVAWQHREISVLRNIIPTVMSFVGFLLLLLLIYLCYRRYNREQEEIELKIANSANEFALESNR